MLITQVRAVAISSNTVFSLRQSSNLGYAVHMPQRLVFGLVDQICTSRSESGYGRGRSSTVFTTLKMAVLEPIPSARVSTATAVKPGARARFRTLLSRCAPATPVNGLRDAVLWPVPRRHKHAGRQASLRAAAIPAPGNSPRAAPDGSRS